MSKSKQKKKNQVIALFIVAVIAIIGMTIFLYRNEILKAINNENEKIMKEAGWDSNVDFGELEENIEPENTNNNGSLYTTMDDLGNGYEVYNINSIYTALPLFSSSQWDYDIYNDSFAYINREENGPYKGIQLVVIPVNNIYNDLYEFKSLSEDVLKNSITYVGKQPFKAFKMIFNSADNTSHSDDYLEYEPNLDLQSIKNRTQYINKYMNVQYIADNTKAYIIYGIGDKDQKEYISEFIKTIRKHIKALNNIPTSNLYLNKEEEVNGIGVKMPINSDYENSDGMLMGRLSKDIRDEFSNIYIVRMVTDSEIDLSKLSNKEIVAIKRLYMRKMFPSDIYMQVMSNADLSDIYISLVDNNEDGAIYQVSSSSNMSFYEPLYVYISAKEVASGKYIENFILSNSNIYNTAKKCFEAII